MARASRSDAGGDFTLCNATEVVAVARAAVGAARCAAGGATIVVETACRATIGGFGGGMRVAEPALVATGDEMLVAARAEAGVAIRAPATAKEAEVRLGVAAATGRGATAALGDRGATIGAGLRAATVVAATVTVRPAVFGGDAGLGVVGEGFARLLAFG